MKSLRRHLWYEVAVLIVVTILTFQAVFTGIDIYDNVLRFHSDEFVRKAAGIFVAFLFFYGMLSWYMTRDIRQIWQQLHREEVCQAGEDM